MTRKRAKWVGELEMALWGCRSRAEAVAAVTALDGDWQDPSGWTVEDTVTSLEWLWRQQGWKGWPEDRTQKRPLS